MRENITYSYCSEGINGLFNVKINDEDFIDSLVIKSITISDDIIIVFNGTKLSIIKNNLGLVLPLEESNIDESDIINYFKDKSHTITLDIYDRTGAVINETIYNTNYKSIVKIANNNYVLTLNRIK